MTPHFVFRVDSRRDGCTAGVRGTHTLSDDAVGSGVYRERYVADCMCYCARQAAPFDPTRRAVDARAFR